MERERSRYYAQVIGNALLAGAGLALLLGTLAIGRLIADFEDQFFGQGSEGPEFNDYLWFFLTYGLGVLTLTAILGAAGLYFRWLAVEQDARMVEFDMLLDALGVPVEDGVEDQPRETTPDA
jgi:hypothetical protein